MSLLCRFTAPTAAPAAPSSRPTAAQRRIQHRKAGLSALQQTCRLHGKGREGGEAAAHPHPKEQKHLRVQLGILPRQRPD